MRAPARNRGRRRLRASLVSVALAGGTLVSVAGGTPAVAGDCPPGDPLFSAPIAVPTFGGTTSVANAVNDLNPPVVVGYGSDGDGQNHALRWKQGTMPADLGQGIAYDVNDKLQVVGYATSVDGPTLWSSQGVAGGLDDLESGTVNGGTAHAINESGQIAGEDYGQDPETFDDDLHAVRWDSPSSATDLHQGGEDGWTLSGAVGINESGTVVGNWQVLPSQAVHGEVWTGNSGDELPSPNSDSWAYAINDTGKSVGTYDVPGDTVGAIWLAGATGPTDLPGDGTPLSISNSDNIVGYTSEFRAAVWLSNGHGAWAFHDLNCVIPSGSSWTLQVANDINGRGDIVGYGTNPDGKLQGFLVRRAVQELLDLSVANGVGIEGSTAVAGRTIPPTGRVVFTVRRSGVGVASSVHYTTVAGTAKPGLDYTAVEGTLQFTKTQKTKTVTVLLKRDHRDEPNETFTLKLSRPVKAHIADGTGLGTIRDDD